jgi:hypothetical protein
LTAAEEDTPKRVSCSLSHTTRIAKAQIVRIGAKRYLVVKVKSNHQRVKLAVRLKLRNGAVLTATKKVRANKTVRVMRLSSGVKSVKVKLAK